MLNCWMLNLLLRGVVFLSVTHCCCSQSEGRVPPLMVLEPSVQVDYRLGYNIRLPCRASGVPPPIYSWRRNGEVLEISADGTISIMPDDGTLVIDKGRPINEGEYQCFATNDLGTAVSVKTFLRPAVLSNFDPNPIRTFTPTLGSPLRITCSWPKNYPNPQIFWSIIYPGSPGIQIDQTDRIVIDPSGALNFLNVLPEDGLLDRSGNRGKYACRAYNPVLREFQEGDYAQIIPRGESPRGHDPVFLWKSQPTTETGVAGRPFSITCVVGGNPAPEVGFSRKDADLPVGRHRFDKYGMELVFTDLRSEDSGVYDCSGLLGVASAERTFTIAVHSAPTWVDKPTDVMASPGETATFYCSGHGEPQPERLWYINGQKISDKPPEWVLLRDNVLTVPNVEAGQSFTLQCNISNKHGYVFTNAYLNVQSEKPMMELSPPASVITAEGQDVTLNCQAYGSPRPQMVWRYGGNEELTGGRFTVLSHGALIIQNIQLPDAGIYSCQAFNKFGSSEVASTNLIVRRRTTLRTVPEDVIITEGNEGRFTCSATTDPEEVQNLRIDWKQNGQVIDIQSLQRIYKNLFDDSLIISHSSPDDTGTYTCVASNGLDSVEANAKLTVEGIPETPKIINVQCLPGENAANIQWTSLGSNNAPILQYLIQTRFKTGFKWVDAVLANGEDINAEVPLTPNGKFSFRILAKNRIGWSLPSGASRTTCEVRPQPPPYNPKNIATWNSNEKGLLIRWTSMSPEEHYGNDFSYHLQYKTDDDPSLWSKVYSIPNWKQSELHIVTAGSFKRYRIRVWVSNSIGDTSGAPAEIIGFSAEGTPTARVQNFKEDEQKAAIISPRSVSFSWDVIDPTVENVMGFMKGFIIQLREMDGSVVTPEVQKYPREVEVNLDYDQQEKLRQLLRDNVEPIGVARQGEGTAKNVRGRRQALDEIPPELVNRTIEIPVSTTINNLPSLKKFRANILVQNTDVSGPISDPDIDFTTAEGPPGPVRMMRVVVRAPNMLQVSWTPPDEPSGILTGYHFSVQMIHNLKMGTEERLPDSAPASADSFRITGLMPDQLYRVYIRAATSAGFGEAYFLDVRTTPPLPPGAPSFTVWDVTEDGFRVRFTPSASDNPGSAFIVEYRIKDTGQWLSSAPEVSARSVSVHGLMPGTKYEVRVVAANGFIMQRTASPVQEVTVGGQAATQVFEGDTWFIAVIFILLLLIALLVAMVFARRRMKTVALKREERLRKYRSGSLYHGEHGILNPHVEPLAAASSMRSTDIRSDVDKSRPSEKGSTSVEGSRTLTASQSIDTQPTYPLHPPREPRTRGTIDAPPSYGTVSSASTDRAPRGYSRSTLNSSAQGSGDLPIPRGSQSTVQGSRGGLNPSRGAPPPPVYGSVHGMAQPSQTTAPRGPRYAAGPAADEPQAYPTYKPQSTSTAPHYSTTQSSMPRYMGSQPTVSPIPRYNTSSDSPIPRYTGSRENLAESPHPRYTGSRENLAGSPHPRYTGSRENLAEAPRPRYAGSRENLAEAPRLRYAGSRENLDGSPMHSAYSGSRGHVQLRPEDDISSSHV